MSVPAHGLDWDLLLEMTERHSLVPFLYRAIGREPEFPAAFRQRLEARYQESLRRNLFLTAELLRLLDTFAAAGISVLPYKGPVLAQALYGDLGLRTFSDLDLLVRAADVPRAAHLLEDAGYRPDPPIGSTVRPAQLRVASEQMFRRAAGAALVELQWQIAPSYFSVDFHIEWFWTTAVPVILEARNVLSLAPEPLLLALAVHGAKHQWERLVWVADVAHFVRRYPQFDWDSALSSARKLRIERLVLLAVALAENLFAIELPVHLRTRVAADRVVPELCAAAERFLASQVRGVPGPAGHWFVLRARERWRDRWRYAVRLALTPNPRDWAALPLPAALAPLYFGLRPLRLLGRALRRGWRRLLGTAPAAASGEATEVVRRP